MKTVIGVTGMPGSGKSVVARHLAMRLACPHVELSSYLIEARDDPRDVNATRLRWTQSTDLRKSLGPTFLVERAMHDLESRGADRGVVDGIRTLAECVFFASRCFFFLVGFQRPPHLRYKRLSNTPRTTLFRDEPNALFELDAHEIRLGVGGALAASDHLVFSDALDGNLDDQARTVADAICVAAGRAEREADVKRIHRRFSVLAHAPAGGE